MGKEYSNYKKKCKCGKGEILVTLELDDFNNSRRSETLNCECCKFEDEKRIRILKDKIKVVMLYFNENYLNDFKSKLSFFRSKKEMFLFLKNYDLIDYSINKFYKIMKDTSFNNYINSLITLDNLKNILKALDICDENLNQLIKEPLRIKKQIDEEALVEYKMNNDL